MTRSTGSYTHRRHRLYDTVEFIGRWSMVDVFVVAIVSALVNVNRLRPIKPGVAALSFALSVGFTMLSAQSFDPRLIWDTVSDGNRPGAIYKARAPVPDERMSVVRPAPIGAPPISLAIAWRTTRAEGR